MLLYRYISSPVSISGTTALCWIYPWIVFKFVISCWFSSFVNMKSIYVFPIWISPLLFLLKQSISHIFLCFDRTMKTFFLHWLTPCRWTPLNPSKCWLAFHWSQPTAELTQLQYSQSTHFSNHCRKIIFFRTHVTGKHSHQSESAYLQQPIKLPSFYHTPFSTTSN